MYIENESKGKHTCSHAPYTRFTSVNPFKIQIKKKTSKPNNRGV